MAIRRLPDNVVDGLICYVRNSEAAAKWFEAQHWPDGEICCLHCGETDAIQHLPRAKPMPYPCSDCRKYFSLRTGTAIEHNKIQLCKWAIAIYLILTHPTGVFIIQLARDLGITQKSVRFLAHRIRKAFDVGMLDFAGPVEVDETYIAGKEKNKYRDKKLKACRGTVGKIPVVGVGDRATNSVAAEPMTTANRENAERLIRDAVAPGAKVYTDDSAVYAQIENYESVNHSAKVYVRGEVHTNGIESFRALLKRGY